jgi:ABC-type multidrug transport system fused ATPase/permease subunit
VVSQEPVLFNDTIGGNIQYNKNDVTEEDIRAAATLSNFNPEDDFIRKTLVLRKSTSRIKLD